MYLILFISSCILGMEIERTSWQMAGIDSALPQFQQKEISWHKLIPFLNRSEKKSLLKKINQCEDPKNIPSIISQKISNFYEHTLSTIEKEPTLIKTFSKHQGYRDFRISPCGKYIVTQEGCIINTQTDSLYRSPMLDRVYLPACSFYNNLLCYKLSLGSGSFLSDLDNPHHKPLFFAHSSSSKPV
ncbi:MAG: hypothetical protein M1114_02490, partial [Candidatus Dependentiae bacterium]|nr:hypothetical protein [Candidatus Dependentiae bacterium]